MADYEERRERVQGLRRLSGLQGSGAGCVGGVEGQRGGGLLERDQLTPSEKKRVRAMLPK
jgi:hypothetical protein